MGLLDNLDRLEKLRPHAVTVWSTTQDGMKYQCNIQIKAGAGWTVAFGLSVESALEACITSTLKGERTYQGLTQAEVARNVIRAAADPDDDDRTPQKRPERSQAQRAGIAGPNDPPKRGEPGKQQRMRF